MQFLNEKELGSVLDKRKACPNLYHNIICFDFTDVNLFLNKFRASKGWEAGIDGNVAIIAVGGGGSATTRNVNEPIVGYVFDVKGLMGDISLKGAKFSKIDPAQ